MERKNAWKSCDEAKLAQVNALCTDYIKFISDCKTERECVEESIRLAEAAGYKNLNDCIEAGTPLKAGDKVYANNMGKTIALFVVGTEPMEKGMHILGAHIDSPRIDVKQNPLYQDEDFALLDTHYYGGIKKYQWVALPLALHGVVAKKTTVLDEVFYTNLIPGKEYTVSGKLMVKETGEPLLIDGKEVTTEKTFVAEEADGSIILEFTFDSSALAGKKIVAFEDITYEGISIGSHEDLTDEDQTISYPEIHTTAVNGTDGSKTMVLGTNVTLMDTVTYKGLTAGKTYVLKGTIMDKTSGQSIGVTAETTFTAEAADGSVTVTFTFDTTKLQGKTLVVFETLYDTQGNPIVDHSDLNDEDQTVSVPVQPVIPPVVTGDDSSPMPYVLSLLAALAAAVAVVAVLVRRKRKQA